MSLLDLFRRRNSAPVARERLQVLLAHERSAIGESDLLTTLKKEILAVIARHVAVEPDRVQVKLERGGATSILEIDIEVPQQFARSSRAGAPKAA